MSEIRDKLEGLKIDREDEASSASLPWLPIGLALLVLLALAAWWLLPQAAAEVRSVAARAARSESAPTVLNATGYVTARRQATVSSKVTGKVVEVLIEEGMAVEEGQVLARLDASNVGAAVRLADAQLEAARAAVEETRVRLAEAELDLGRTKKLVANQIASQSELDAALAEVDSLKARLESQTRDVAVAERAAGLRRQDLEDTVIRAPFTGIVVAKNAQPGEMISPISAGGGFTRTGIGTIVDMDSLEIEVDVNESYINRVESGQPVEATLDAYPDWKIPGRVIAIVPTADRQKATVRVRIGFAELDPRILPDMGIKVAFQGTEGDAASRSSGVTIPRAALRRDGERDVVMVVVDDTVERRAVSVALGEGDEALILAGLDAGERVVLEGPAELAEGDRIKEIEG